MNDVSNRTTVQEPAMYQHMSAEVGRTRQSDLRAAAAHRRQVAEATGERTGATTRLRNVMGRLVVRRPVVSTTPAVRPVIKPAN